MVVSAQIESFGSLTRAEDLILSCGGEQTADPGELTIGGRTVQVGGPFVPIAGDTITASVPWSCVPGKAPAGKPRFVAVLTSAHRPTRLPLPDAATFALADASPLTGLQPGLRSVVATFDGPRRVVSIEALRTCAPLPGGILMRTLSMRVHAGVPANGNLSQIGAPAFLDGSTQRAGSGRFTRLTASAPSGKLRYDGYLRMRGCPGDTASVAFAVHLAPRP